MERLGHAAEIGLQPGALLAAIPIAVPNPPASNPSFGVVLVADRHADARLHLHADHVRRQDIGSRAPALL